MFVTYKFVSSSGSQEFHLRRICFPFIRSI